MITPTRIVHCTIIKYSYYPHCTGKLQIHKLLVHISIKTYQILLSMIYTKEPVKIEYNVIAVITS